MNRLCLYLSIFPWNGTRFALHIFQKENKNEIKHMIKETDKWEKKSKKI
jgi:hypothetical protein